MLVTAQFVDTLREIVRIYNQPEFDEITADDLRPVIGQAAQFVAAYDEKMPAPIIDRNGHQRYDLRNTVDQGKPIGMFDATGKQYYWTISCCIETGEIIKQVVDETSHAVITDMGVIEELVIAPAPLRVVPAGYCIHPKRGDKRWE